MTKKPQNSSKPFSSIDWMLTALEKFYKFLVKTPRRVFVSRLIMWGLVWFSICFSHGLYTVLLGSIGFVLYGGLEYRLGIMEGAIMMRQYIMGQAQGVANMKSIIDEVLRKKEK